MAEQQSIENRLTVIERKIAELEKARAHLLTLATLQVKVGELREMFDGLQDYVGDQVQTLREDMTVQFALVETSIEQLQAGQEKLQSTQQTLQQGVQELQAGQQQILDILLSKLKTND